MKDNKAMYWVVGVLVVVALWFLVKGKSDDQAQVSPSPSDQMATESTSPGATVSGSPANPNTGTAASYAAALKRYEGNRFQFDKYCQTEPNAATYKNGATVMLDNRSGDARTVKVGANSYNLAGYGWRVITLSSSTLPTTLYLDCGSAKNVAKIQLYK